MSESVLSAFTMDWRYAGASSYSYESAGYSPKKPSVNRAKYTEKVELWVCKICDKDFASQGGLNRHFTTVHEQPKPRALKNGPDRAVVPKVQQSFTCRYCGNDYASQSNLNRHVATIHEKAVVQPRTNVAVAKSTKIVQKNTTNVVVNVYNPTYYNSNRY